jgi:similar to spore coat protein
VEVEVFTVNEKGLAPHETMDIHELLNCKTIGLAKAKLMQGLVFDKDLKALMQKNVEQSIKAIEDLESLYRKVTIQ